MNREQIIELIKASLKALLRSDNLLLSYNVQVQCLDHRLAFYFETLFREIANTDIMFQVDLAYNKNINSKTQEIRDLSWDVTPNIVIHKKEKYNQDNLLACVCKYSVMELRDIVKLRNSLRIPFNYKFAAGISYMPNSPYFDFTLYELKEKGFLKEAFRILKN